MSNLVQILGDSTNNQHRTALQGNAMLFNTQRWILLEDGLDVIPFFEKPLTYCINYINLRETPVNVEIGGNVIFSQNDFDDWTGVPGGTATLYHVYSGLRVSCALLSENTPTSQRKGHFFQLPIGTKLNYINSFDATSNLTGFINLTQGKNILSTSTFLTRRTTINNRVGIGSHPNRADRLVPRIAENAFLGYIRSIEILNNKNCNEQELRAIFNYGTIYNAYQAGKVTISNLKNLISIDFNRTNGQLPICQLGTMDLTITPYNNSTPDVAGTLYADYYSL